MAGGRDQQDKSTNIVEIIDLVNPNFKYKWNDERAARVASFGGILQNKPLLFGGRDQTSFNDGIALGSNENIYEYEIEKRSGASSVILNQTRLWVTGGMDEKGNLMKSSQFISLDRPPEKGPELPFTVSHHCMVQVDSKTIYLIGGYQNDNRRSRDVSPGSNNSYCRTY